MSLAFENRENALALQKSALWVNNALCYQFGHAAKWMSKLIETHILQPLQQRIMLMQGYKEFCPPPHSSMRITAERGPEVGVTCATNADRDDSRQSTWPQLAHHQSWQHWSHLVWLHSMPLWHKEAFTDIEEIYNVRRRMEKSHAVCWRHIFLTLLHSILRVVVLSVIEGTISYHITGQLLRKPFNW